MKDIIYLDKEVIHSFIAQQYDGLPTELVNHQEQEITDGMEKDQGYNSRSSIEAVFKSGNLEIPVLFNGPEGELKGILQPGKFASEKSIMSQTETGKEIIAKQLHDNTLEKLIKHLEKNNELYDPNYSNTLGKYVKFTSGFNIIDFNYLKNVFQTDKLMEFMFNEYEKQLEDLQNQEKTFPKKSKERNEIRRKINKLKSEIDQAKKDTKKEFDFIEMSLEYLNDILPNPAFISVGNTLAPLKSDYLRNNADELMFKYSNSDLEVSLLGKVTNKIKNIDMPNFDDEIPFQQLPLVINSVLGALGIIKTGDLIISPIAIYFE